MNKIYCIIIFIIFWVYIFAQEGREYSYIEEVIRICESESNIDLRIELYKCALISLDDKKDELVFEYISLSFYLVNTYIQKGDNVFIKKILNSVLDIVRKKLDEERKLSDRKFKDVILNTIDKEQILLSILEKQKYEFENYFYYTYEILKVAYCYYLIKDYKASIDLYNYAWNINCKMYDVKSHNYKMGFDYLLKYYLNQSIITKQQDYNDKIDTIYQNYLDLRLQSYKYSREIKSFIDNSILNIEYILENKKAIKFYSLKKLNFIKNALWLNFNFQTAQDREVYKLSFDDDINTVYSDIYYYLQNDIKVLSNLYNTILMSKGLLINVISQINNAILNSGNQELIYKFKQLCELKQQIINLESQLTKEQNLKELDRLNDDANALDKDLALSSLDYRQDKEVWDIEWDDVKKKLKPNEVAIEFISFDYYHKGEFTDSTLYCALLLRNNSQYPEMITLFEEKEVLDIVLNNEPSLIYNNLNMYYKVWQPLEKYIKEGDTVYFSPSGLYHKLNLGAIATPDGKIIKDKYNLVRLSSTRELVLSLREGNSNSSAVLYGGINYNSTPSVMYEESDKYRSRSGDEPNRVAVDYLPGAKLEVENIESLLQKYSVQTIVYSGDSAVEESFKALSGKGNRILHIATHGFFWEEEKAKKQDFLKNRGLMSLTEREKVVIDPLSRSGLLLSGANNAYLGYADILPNGVDDGVLTAKEISNLDLRGTELVVLSACETGLGDITSEGVFGLQRAFKQAGVETMIMSLWKVDDEATQKLMTEFYNNWIVKKQTKREAFNNAQNAVRAEYKDPKYWAGFVMLD